MWWHHYRSYAYRHISVTQYLAVSFSFSTSVNVKRFLPREVFSDFMLVPSWPLRPAAVSISQILILMSVSVLLITHVYLHTSSHRAFGLIYASTFLHFKVFSHVKNTDSCFKWCLKSLLGWGWLSVHLFYSCTMHTMRKQWENTHKSEYIVHCTVLLYTVNRNVMYAAHSKSQFPWFFSTQALAIQTLATTKELVRSARPTEVTPSSVMCASVHQASVECTANTVSAWRHIWVQFSLYIFIHYVMNIYCTQNKFNSRPCTMKQMLNVCHRLNYCSKMNTHSPL